MSNDNVSAFILFLDGSPETVTLKSEGLEEVLKGEINPCLFVTLCSSIDAHGVLSQDVIEDVLCYTLTRLINDQESGLNNGHLESIVERFDGRLAEKAREELLKRS